ncbi:L-serine ammonia-lyase [Asticcacaulis sp. SL142]|uniref:L-serine ammonia-lyase n=1 Tax=Asticcacaulis sp. SL142 TaxID=2995155 RepID=UPI00226CF42A|nr:L-serine ammonia-lyase [Asticcacaulis sp. SL142]WAC46904.1 L-serine ammonia-lyase [Asticcacaulis sp. SL142]
MLSVLDIFKIGIGPSSSHTVGPMRISTRALADAAAAGVLSKAARVRIELQGSLALTGIGHGSDKAAVLGLLGAEPDTVDPDWAEATFLQLKTATEIALHNGPVVPFNFRQDVDFRGDIVPRLHPNGLCVRLYDAVGVVIFERTFYSVGGGFIASSEQLSRPPENDLIGIAGKGALPFGSAAQLLEHCAQHGINVYDVVLVNEDAKRPRAETDAGLKRIWDAMDGSIDRGLRIEGILPGGLSVRRRASSLYETLTSESHNQESERLFDWLNVFAMAVNEENAAGGRVVTAPTNGAAGIIPALIRYYCAQDGWIDEDTKADGKIGRFLLTAAGIGMIYKQRASLSGAEMGCQGEVGVACSMGAAGLCAVWGGTAAQIEHAAEIGMEHNLGLTCDPVGGLVQIPCIERNAIGAVKAANAARLSLRDHSEHKVTLDQVIETMRQTGLDMSSKYKETSQGGLAVNVVEC